MKHYDQMVELGCFSRIELADKLGCSIATAASVIQQYLAKGYIERVRHNFYVVINLATKQPLLSNYALGSRLFPDAFVSYHSAFEVYGYANQVFFEITVTSKHRFRDFNYQGVTFRRASPKGDPEVISEGLIRVSGLERTVVDCIDDIGRAGGLEELVRCLMLVPSLRAERLLDALSDYKNGFLYQKTGYLMEQMNEEFLLPPSFFDICKKRISGANRYLVKEPIDYEFHEKWNLYAPSNIKKIVNKGIVENAEI